MRIEQAAYRTATNHTNSHQNSEVRMKKLEERVPHVSPLLRDMGFHCLFPLPTSVELPLHIRQALAFARADAISILRVQAHLSILIHDLRMQRENHVFLQFHVAGCADRGILKHGRPDAVSRQMPERESLLRERFRHGPMNIAGALSS